MFTVFMDMNSDGYQKTKYCHIYIEASEERASEAFKLLLGENPSDVACPCCGENFYVMEEDTEDLEELIEFERKLGKGPLPPATVEEFFSREEILLVSKEEVEKILKGAEVVLTKREKMAALVESFVELCGGNVNPDDLMDCLDQIEEL